jgi:hypothetical protein
MQIMEVILPGGLSQDGFIERRARFRPLNGRVEQALIDFDIGANRSAYVTAVLAEVLDSFGDKPADTTQISNLCVADRQFLMLRLAAMFEGEHMWLKVGCGGCDAPFDVELKRCDLPIKQAGAGFPQVSIRLGEREIDARVPTGEDQERIAALSEDEAMLQLLRNCIQLVDGEPVETDFIENLSAAEIDKIDTELDEVSPAICDQLLVTCPECGQEQHTKLDHYAHTGIDRYFFYDEIHTLASHYHWSEAAILDLPQQKRRLYLDLINRSPDRHQQRYMS